MTILLVDAGNSRLKWSEMDATTGAMSVQYAQSYGDRPALEIFIRLLERYPDTKRITLVHVLTHLFVDSVQTLCAERSIVLTIVRSVEHGYGITSGYQYPKTLGADRFVGLVAARQLANKQACLVIDCGTAVTIDAVDADGLHLGGVIFAGLQLSADALIARAQGKLCVTFDEPTVFANCTSHAIGGGCLFALVGAIEGICTQMQQRSKTSMVRVLAGGDAANLHVHLGKNYLLQPDLLMQGLRFITQEEACYGS